MFGPTKQAYTVMKLSDTIKSRFLKACDLGDTGKVLTIKDATTETIGKPPEEKLILWFKETPKGLVMNNINTRKLIELLGDTDVDDCAGQKVKLVESSETYSNGNKGIRLVAAPAKKAPTPSESAPASSEEDDVKY